MNTFTKTKIAIIGYSHILPNDIDDEKLWKILKNRECSVVDSSFRYGKNIYANNVKSRNNKILTKYENLILDQKEFLFDNSFFNMSEEEISSMDPQQRMALLSAWNTTEKAGIDVTKMRNKNIGVFIGTQIPSATNWYNVKANKYSISSMSSAIIANRVSYHMNLTGPSATYFSACSSSITALDACVNSISIGECDTAFFGGVTYNASFKTSLGFTQLGVISKDGKCSCFDDNANGYSRSEGCITFLLKRLDLAERDHDIIYGVITGSYLNSCGSSEDDNKVSLNPGRSLFAPTTHGQMKVMTECLKCANIHPDEIDYLESHSTGTSVGDFIEGQSIENIFNTETRKNKLYIGSIKSNLGHMESASFACSLLKVVKMIENKTFVPMSNNFKKLNERLNFKTCEVLTRCIPFTSKIAKFGLNNFGFGGANGFAIVEEYRKKYSYNQNIKHDLYMIPLSAKKNDILKEWTNQLGRYLKNLENKPDIYTLAENLTLRRTTYHIRNFILCKDTEDLINQCINYDSNNYCLSSNENKLIYVFSGQGTQWQNCGKELYDNNDEFKKVIDYIDSFWLKKMNVSLKDIAFGNDLNELNKTLYTQPILFMIQYGLYKCYKSWGLKPDCIIGHSLGELVAICIAGITNLDEMLNILLLRAQAQETISGLGNMLIINTRIEDFLELIKEKYDTYSEKETETNELEHLNNQTYSCANQTYSCDNKTYQLNIISNKKHIKKLDFDIACINSENSFVISSSVEYCQIIQNLMLDKGITAKILRGNTPFHSKYLDCLKDEFDKEINKLNINYKKPVTKIISTVTGKFIEQIDNNYWWDNMRKCVLFKDALNLLNQTYESNIILELSPSIALAYHIKTMNPKSRYINSLEFNKSDQYSFMKSIGNLYSNGIKLSYENYFSEPALRITKKMPLYPMKLRKIFDTNNFYNINNNPFSKGPLIGNYLIDKNAEAINSYKFSRFKMYNSGATYNWLLDHKIASKSIMPAASYIEMIAEYVGRSSFIIKNIQFLEPLNITKKNLNHIITECLQDDLDNSIIDISILTFKGKKRKIHCKATVIKNNIEDINDLKNISTIKPKRFNQKLTFSIGKAEKIENTKNEYMMQIAAIKAQSDNDKEELERSRILYEKKLEKIEKSDESSILYDVWDVTTNSHFNYQNYFRVIKEAYQDPTNDEIWSEIEMNNDLFNSCKDNGFILHPCLLDGCLQSTIFQLFKDIDCCTSYPIYAKKIQIYNEMKSNKIICIFKPKLKNDIIQGNYYIKTGQKLIGSLWFYDKYSGEIIGIISELYSIFKRAAHLNAQKYKLITQPICNVNHDELINHYELINRDKIENYINKLTSKYYGNYFYRIIEVIDKSTVINLDQINLDYVEYLYCSTDKELLETAYSQCIDKTLKIKFVHIESLEFEYELYKHSLLSESFVDIIILNSNKIIKKNYNKLLNHGGIIISKFEQENQNKLGSIDSFNIYKKINNKFDVIIPKKKEQVLIFGKKNKLLEEVNLLLENYYDLTFSPDLDSIDMDNIYKIVYYMGNTSKYAVEEYIELIELIKNLDIYSCNKIKLWAISVKAFPQDDIEDVDTSALLGMFNSINIEKNPEIEFFTIDIANTKDINVIPYLIYKNLREQCFIVRDGIPKVQRIIKETPNLKLDCQKSSTIPYTLKITKPGSVRYLEFIKQPLINQLDDNEVKVEIKAAALNFRDIMVLLDKLPPLSYEKSSLGYDIGFEASGIVKKIGRKVSRVKEGDKVIVLQTGCISNIMKVHELKLFQKPDNINFSEGASILSVFITAYYAINEIAHLKKGDSILIHSAMGGVGHAAIEIAKHLGLSIYATAGTEEKRNKLIEMGVVKAYDSHSYSWAKELMIDTNGKGVKAILNSLIGKHIQLGLDSLSSGGWFLEIGKMDIYNNSKLGLQVFRKNIGYRAIDIDRLMLDDPLLMIKLAEKCINQIKNGNYKPIPYSEFDFCDHKKAFTHMLDGKHTGKLVLLNNNNVILDKLETNITEGTYLVSGGFGGMGKYIIPYLSSIGVQKLIMLDRSPEKKRDVEFIKNTFMGPISSEICLEYGSVSDYEFVNKIVNKYKNELRGVVHLAGILNDKYIADQNKDTYMSVILPKAQGAWNLHKATLEANCNLNHFIMLSSIASISGNLGQSNYGAANAYLDGLSFYRNSLGLNSLSYNMPGVSNTGMALTDLSFLKIMFMIGLAPLSAKQAVHFMDISIRNNDKRLIVAYPTKTFKISSNKNSYNILSPLIENKTAYSLLNNNNLSEFSILSNIRNEITEILGQTSKVEVDLSLSSLGMNSINSVQFVTIINSEYNFTIDMDSKTSNLTLREIANKIFNYLKNKDI